MTWLDERRKTIGSSDAPVLWDLSPWQSRYGLWAEKCGVEVKRDVALGEWGHRMEPMIAEWFSEQEERTIERHDQSRTLSNPDYPFAGATPDYYSAKSLTPWVDTHDPDAGILEIKAPVYSDKILWENGPDLMYQVQLQHQLLVTDLSWGTIVWVFPGDSKVSFKDYERDEDFLERHIKRCKDFWALVESGTPPEVDGSSHTKRALISYWDTVEDETVYLPDEYQELDARYCELVDSSKAETEEMELIRNRFRAAIGEKKFGEIPGARWTFSKTKKGRMLRRKAIK